MGSIGAGTFGPIPQNEFLHKLGIRQRMEVCLSYHAYPIMMDTPLTSPYSLSRD